MLIKREYYCLVAGLADLVFDSGKEYPGMTEFREELKSNLHRSDYYLVSLLFLPYDNDNFIAFYEGKTGLWNTLGNYALSDFEEETKVLQSVVKRKDVIPHYMAELMAQRTGEEPTIDRVALWKKLNEGYINLALKSGNRFLEKWICFERDLKNILALLNSRVLNLNASRHIIGNDWFARELISIFNSGKDFIIPSEPEYAPMIFRIATETEFLERERKLDLERWNFIDSMTLFEYFTIDLILGYLIKYFIVLRWKHLEPETGELMLQKLIGQMEAQVMATDYKGKNN